MAGGALPRVTRRGRLWRGLWPGRNPLWRTCDRVEAAFAAGLLAAFLIAAPLLALFAGQWAHGNSVRAQRAALAARHLVPATLLAGAPAQTIYCCAMVRPAGPHLMAQQGPAGFPCLRMRGREAP
jgi:hypothetical protein